MTLGPNVSSLVVKVPIVNNGTPQGPRTVPLGLADNVGSTANKSVTLTLSNPSAGAAMGTPSTPTLWIVDGN